MTIKSAARDIDPAFAAARRFVNQAPEANVNFAVAGMLVAVAREAWKPIRALHVPIVRTDITDERWTECQAGCTGYWPCETAMQVYTTDELRQALAG